MKYKNLITAIYAAALTLTVGITGTAHAVPALQLDAQGGTWINADPNGDPQTTFCSTDVCDFYAIATPKNQLPASEILADTFYVSIALYPKTGPAGANLGSIEINGSTVNVTADMVYGTPPLNDVDGGASDTGDLQPHGIFETYYTQIAIDFVSGQRINTYNVQTAGGDPANEVDANGDSYYDIVTVDTTNLDTSVELHLDLYNALVVECGNNPNCVVGDLDTDLFAPFSHDAQTSSSTSSTGGPSTSSTSSTGGPSTSSTGTGVPEPSTLALLGCSILSGLLFNRRRKTKAQTG